MSETIILVGCSATKLPDPAPARDLYIGYLFRAARAYAEGFGDPRNAMHSRWYILSGLHGVIGPGEIKDPYDYKLTGSNGRDNQTYKRDVLFGLAVIRIAHGARLVVLAPQAYCIFAPEFARLRPDVVIETPLAGLGIGQQKAWLKAETAKLRRLETKQ